MQAILLRALLSLLTLGQVHAVVTWRTIGCDNWSFKGASIDDIWDNALLMTTNAQSQRNAIPTNAAGMLSGNGRRAGANAKFMFGVKFDKLTGMDAAGTTTMNTVNDIYTRIQSGLEGTLPGIDVDNAFLFCESNGLTYGNFPGNPFQQAVWYTTVTNGPVTEYIALQYTAGRGPGKPCMEVGKDQIYQARTFDTVQVINGNPQTFTGVILCPEQFEKNGLRVVPTLSQGFNAVVSGNNKRPTPADYNSISGNLVHEMTHVVGRSQGRRYLDEAAGFNQCLDLAIRDQSTALTNPDNYRVFAEMSMSPSTKWGAETPAPLVSAAPAH
ncbi:hypothetical protein F4677DRAFT_91869 [Hypoxylon crocopeplum]|nr:hypothetical protein F4677DRAFT_91869 [Hypoxylon crocopeplum]